MVKHQPARVLVTGGAGFIGSHLVEALVARNARVTVLDDRRNSSLDGLSSDNLTAAAGSIELVHGDCGAAGLLLARDAYDTIFHLAAPAYVPPSVDDPIGDLRANVEQTLLLLEAIRGLDRKPRLLHVSSAAVYGAPAVEQIREDMPPAPVSPYGVDKFAAEEHVRVASALHGIPAAILRYFPVYGPRQRKQVVFDLINKVLDDPARIEVFGTGEELRDLVYVSDIVAGTIAAAEHAPARGEAYNVGSGTVARIADIVAAVTAALGADPEIAYTGSVRPGDSTRMCADITKLRSLGFEPATDLHDGIARTVAWVLDARGGSPARTQEGAA